MKTRPQTLGYIRVSTDEQDTEKNHAAILDFANARDFGKVEFVEEKISGMVSWRKRKLAEVVDHLKAGDRLIVPELSRLGRSLVEVLEVLNVLKDKDVAVYSVKEGFKLNGSDMQSKIMRTMLALFAEIEHDLIVSRTKEGLAMARLKGSRLGRRPGPGKSKLDPHKDEIIALIKTGSRRNYIAKKFGTSEVNLSLWLKSRGLRDLKEEY
jgi:DNA invertase Pin-like site-specific DNA recombinase